jgi:hypothetical protein
LTFIAVEEEVNSAPRLPGVVVNGAALSAASAAICTVSEPFVDVGADVKCTVATLM